MYTLVMVIVAWSHSPGATDTVTPMTFRVPTKEQCEDTARKLAGQSSRQIVIKGFCIPAG